VGAGVGAGVGGTGVGGDVGADVGDDVGADVGAVVGARVICLHWVAPGEDVSSPAGHGRHSVTERQPSG
jgi:hypothetical protein